jgi:predicted  nucleic acid-binding Zn-ribbon protein
MKFIFSFNTNIMKELEILQEKMDVLLKEYVALKKGMGNLEKLLDKKEKHIQVQENKIATLEEALNLKSIVLTSTSMDEKYREILKDNMDKVIKRIDDIINEM